MHAKFDGPDTYSVQNRRDELDERTPHRNCIPGFSTRRMHGGAGLPRPKALRRGSVRQSQRRPPLRKPA